MERNESVLSSRRCGRRIQMMVGAGGTGRFGSLSAATPSIPHVAPYVPGQGKAMEESNSTQLPGATFFFDCIQLTGGYVQA